MKNTDQEDMDRWFKILSDEQRAEIMKAQIIEGEKTKRQMIESESLYKHSDNYALIRVIFIIFLFLTVACATCVSERYMELQKNPTRAMPSTSAVVAP